MVGVKLTAHKFTSGEAARKQQATKAAHKSASPIEGVKKALRGSPGAVCTP